MTYQTKEKRLVRTTPSPSPTQRYSADMARALWTAGGAMGGVIGGVGSRLDSDKQFVFHPVLRRAIVLVDMGGSARALPP